MGRKQTRQQSINSAMERGIGMIRKVSRASVGMVLSAIRKTTLEGPFKLLILALIFAFILVVVWQTFRDRDVSFAPILVPEALANVGYTPRVAVQRVIDRMNVVYGESIKLTNDPETLLSG